MKLLLLASGLALGAACAEPFYDSDLGVSGVAVSEGSLTGVFAIKGVAVDQADTVLGPVDTGGMSFYLSRRSWNDETKVYDEILRTCAVENFETAGLQTENSEAGIASIEEMPSTITVDHASGAFVRQTFHEYWAIEGLDDGDDLPADKDSDVYFDADGDDHPGITVFTQGLVPNGEVYVAQRKTVDTDGVVRSTDQSFGLLHAKKEGVVLGANNDLLLNEAERVPHPDPKQSWWMEVRLDDTAGCEEVKAARDSDELPRRRPF